MVQENQSLLLFEQIVLLTVESRYVKHLACNVLAVVSEFMATSVCYSFIAFSSRFVWQFGDFLWLIMSFMCAFVGKPLGGLYSFVV